MSVLSKNLFTNIVSMFNEIIPAYFEDAAQDNEPIYCVINSPIRTGITDEDAELIAFYVDVYGNDKLFDNGEDIIDVCDNIRNRLNKSIIKAPQLSGHLNFEKETPLQEAEFDINHRRQEWTARVFYYNKEGD